MEFSVSLENTGTPSDAMAKQSTRGGFYFPLAFTTPASRHGAAAGTAERRLATEAVSAPTHRA
jgi:hypothetical protein